MGVFSKIKKIVMKSTATKLATAAVVVAVLGGGVAGIVYANVVNSAEAVVGRAFLTVFSQGESSGEAVFGFKALAEALHAQGTELGLEAVVEEIPLDIGSGAITVPNAGASLVFRTNTAKESNVDLEVKVANTSLISGKLYADEKQLQLTVPKLSKSILAVNYGSETFKEDLKNCYLVDYAGIPQATLDKVLEYLPEDTEAEETSHVEDIQQKLLELLFSGLQDNFAETELKKAGKTELTVGEEMLKCKTYSTTVYRGNVSDFLYEYTLSVKNYIKELAAEQEITAEEVDYAFYKLDTAVGYIRNAITDVEVTYYVYEDRLVQMTADWGMDWTLEEPEPGRLWVTLATTGNPWENMQFILDLPIHRDSAETEIPQQIEIDYQQLTENTEDVYAVDFQVLYNEKPLLLSFDFEKLGGEFVVFVKDARQSLEVNGVINELEKGRKISLEVDDYTYIEGDYTEEQELNISLYVKVLEETVGVLAENPKDALAMTEADVTALEEEIIANVYMLALRIMGLMQ